ncbi:hypothetical protein [Nocardiopsis sp. FIRDI 009]|nr:hypothetical protein [Nocardiopsis sp. FIRDI 009]
MVVLTGPTGNIGAELLCLLATDADPHHRVAAHDPDRLRAVSEERARA